MSALEADQLPHLLTPPAGPTSFVIAWWGARWGGSQLINQSINAEFVGRRYTTRPGAPAESVKSTIKKYIRESFSKCTGISNVMKVGWRSVPGDWTGVEEATFTKSHVRDQSITSL